LRHTVFVYVRGIALATIPVTVLVFVFAEPLVGLVFERGAFGAADVVDVAGVTRFLAFQIPFYVGSSVVIQALSALRLSETLLWAGVLALVTKVALNLALLPGMGLAGLGVATSVMYAASFALMLARLLGALRMPRGGGQSG
jgi:putative peptidoglycan lipid II flippase